MSNDLTPHEAEILRLWGVIRNLTQWRRISMTDKQEAIFGAVFNEFARANAKHPPMHSHHEAYAVLLEEVEEYWREVQKGGGTPRDPQALRTELIHVAAMAIRSLYDLCEGQ
jgi:hypothetical protein